MNQLTFFPQGETSNMSEKTPAQRLAEIQTEKQKLIDEEKTLIDQTKQIALEQVKELVKQYGLKASECGFERSSATTKKSATGKTPAAIKYQNPEKSDETWMGKGRMAGWLADKIKAGKKKEDFLVKNSWETLPFRSKGNPPAG